jgi:signal transduction histidine kinase
MNAHVLHQLYHSLSALCLLLLPLAPPGAWLWYRLRTSDSLLASDVQVLFLTGFSTILGSYLTRRIMNHRLSRSFHRLTALLEAANIRLSQACCPIQSTHLPDIRAENFASLEGSLCTLAQRLGHLIEKMEVSRGAALRSEKLACLGLLAASACHELRNPLLSIKMLIEGLREEFGERDYAVNDFLVIEREVVRMQKCLDGFVGLARPAKLERVRFCLEPVIHQTIALIGICARNQRVRIQFDRPSVPATVEGDPGQIEQVLVNLMINALEEMPSGGQLKIVLACEFDHIEVRVEDSGPGINPARLRYLFNSSGSSKETGHGLGLALSLSIAESHGGSLKAANTLGGGARFTLYLPMARPIGPASPAFEYDDVDRTERAAV